MYAGAKVLIVENEDSNRLLMEKILSLVGYLCVSASNGQEALEVFSRERPRIVLTDISMPVMDGYEEIARLRALPEGARVPIVAVTAHAMAGDREFALRGGCNDYLVKPYRPRDLLEVVERLLKEASS
jgi:CheY-like chemotaxis protein